MSTIAFVTTASHPHPAHTCDSCQPQPCRSFWGVSIPGLLHSSVPIVRTAWVTDHWFLPEWPVMVLGEMGRIPAGWGTTEGSPGLPDGPCVRVGHGPAAHPSSSWPCRKSDPEIPQELAHSFLPSSKQGSRSAPAGRRQRAQEGHVGAWAQPGAQSTVARSPPEVTGESQTPEKASCLQFLQVPP